MYRNTRFSQLMEQFPRGLFDKRVNELKTDRYAKRFSSWDHLIAMMYLQLSGQSSLRDLQCSFNSHTNVHYHLGTQALKRSTLADANKRIDSTLYLDICQALLAKVKRKCRQQVENALYLLDSTPIQLKGRGYDQWAAKNRTYRCQGLKLNVLYDHSGATPVYAAISNPNVTDITDGRKVPLESGATYVFDKGYNDYNWWYEIESQNAIFVTRFKQNAAFKLLSSVQPDDVDSPILCDQKVKFKNRRPGGKRINHYMKPLRCVVVDRPDKTTPLVLATNDMARPAEDIAELYKARWQIELFFKWIKQNLKIKHFISHDENAVRNQIYIAIIAYLLLYLHRPQTGYEGSLKSFVVVISCTLFNRPETEETVYRRRRKTRQEIDKSQPNFWP